jgi:hypothetical protein
MQIHATSFLAGIVCEEKKSRAGWFLFGSDILRARREVLRSPIDVEVSDSKIQIANSKLPASKRVPCSAMAIRNDGVDANHRIRPANCPRWAPSRASSILLIGNDYHDH